MAGANRTNLKQAYRMDVAGARRSTEVRERIMLAAAVADLREILYGQQCLLDALIQALADRGLIDAGDLRRPTGEFGTAVLQNPPRSPDRSSS